MSAQMNTNIPSYLESVGITCEQIADCLETITEKYYRQKYSERSTGSRVNYVVENRYTVGSTIAMNAYEIPFHRERFNEKYHGESYGNFDFDVEDKITGLKVKFNDKHIHIIRLHQKFEDSDTYAVNPLTLIQIFDLKPGVSYKPIYKTSSKWRNYGYTNVCNNTIRELISHLAPKIYQPKTNTKILVMPNNLFYTHGTSVAENCVVEALRNAKNKSLSIEETYRSVYQELNSFWKEYLLYIQSKEMTENALEKYKNDSDQLVKALGDIKKFINKVQPDLILSEDEIEEKIKKNTVLLKSYNETGSLDDMWLISYCDDDDFETKLEGSDIHISSGTSGFKLEYYQYVAINETD